MPRLVIHYSRGFIICCSALFAILPGYAQDSLVSDNSSSAVIAENIEKQLRDTVSLWAQAWSSQQSDRYIDFYSDEYMAPEFTERSAWILNRIARIEGPEYIRVRLFDFNLLEAISDRATVRITQLYERPGYRDRTIKQLVLSRRDSEWKITSEESISVEQLE